MTNIDRLSAVLKEWLRPILAEVLPNVKIPGQTAIGGFMKNMLGIDLSTYNIWEELGTIVLDPTIEQALRPAMRQLAGLVPDEDIPAAAKSYIAAFKRKAHDDGVVNVFGIQFEERAFDNLESLFNSHFKNE